MAMFVINRQWLQVQLFLTMNMFSLSFVATVMPFEYSHMNYLSAFNEMIATFIAYFLCQTNDKKYGPESNVHIGEFIIYLLYVCWAVNGIVIAYFTIKDSYLYLRAVYKKRCAKN